MYTNTEIIEVDGKNVTKITILDNELIDLTLDQLRMQKYNELAYSKLAQLEAGFESSVKYGEPRRYSIFNNEMQDTISDASEQMVALESGRQKTLAGVPLGPTDIVKALWHDNNSTQHDIWTYEEFSLFFTELKGFFLSCRLYCESLQGRVMKCVSKEEVNAIYYGLPLTDEETAFNMGLLAEMQGLEITQGL